MSLYPLLRQLLFLLPAELSHDLSLAALGAVGRRRWARHIVQRHLGDKVPALPSELMGLQLPNPVGLAAGLDKQGKAAPAFHAMGFGFVECGTVTPLPQPGNPKPRLFRLSADQAIINRMGFNSIGAAAFVENVKTYVEQVPPSARGVLGLNIGKNAATPIENAIDDYLKAMEMVYPYADYIAVNISSPNTKNLRELQGEEALRGLLQALLSKREQLADRSGIKKPIALKVAPDLSDEDIATVSRVLLEMRIDGLIATNTTITRPELKTKNLIPDEVGGLSGVPLRAMATEVIAKFAHTLQGEVPIIAAGGIDSGQAARDKFAAGASAVQLYTGFIYRGPDVVREIIARL